MTHPTAGTFTWEASSVREALGTSPRRGGGDRSHAGEGPASYTGISTDTRTLLPGALYVALRGPRFDGHAFLQAAREAGAGGAVVDRASGAAVGGEGPGGFALHEVEDTLEALGALARHRRRALPIPVVGITGSSGKTTVKELLAAVLATQRAVHATRGNLNNRVGVPLTLLATPPESEVAVVEMGTNEAGEIAALARIAEPDLAVLTTVGPSHLEGLGDLEGVLAEKLDLLRGLRPGGTAVVGDDPPALPERARTLDVPLRITGLSPAADPEWRGELLEADGEGRWRVRIPAGSFRSGLPGRHGAASALLALGAADLLGVSPSQGFPAVEGIRPSALRGEVRRVGGLTLLVDCYNANPQSTRAALRLLAELPAPGGRVAVLGSMLELGPESPAFHRDILEQALSLPLVGVVAVGAFAEVAEARGGTGEGGASAVGGRPWVLAAPDPEGAWELLEPRLGGGETLLLKGSRGVALERLIPRFEAAFGGEGR